MDIEKLFKEFVEKEWHDGHEPQGGHDHYEEEEVEENLKKKLVLTLRKRKVRMKKHLVFQRKRVM